MIKLRKTPNAAEGNLDQQRNRSDQPASKQSQRAPQRFFTVKQLAARWQISPRQVHRFIADGALTAHKIGRSVRIAETDVLLFELQSR